MCAVQGNGPMKERWPGMLEYQQKVQAMTIDRASYQRIYSNAYRHGKQDALRTALLAEPPADLIAALEDAIRESMSIEIHERVQATVAYFVVRAHLLGEDAKPPRPAPSTDPSHAELSNSGRLLASRPIRGEDDITEDHRPWDEYAQEGTHD